MDFSLDIETLSLQPNAVVTSIAIACENGASFYTHLPLDPQYVIGRIFDQNTIDWWNDTNKEIFEIMMHCCACQPQNRGYIETVFERIALFIDEHDDGTDINLWMKPPSFDSVILKNLGADFKLELPWHYRVERDVRSILSLAEEHANKNNQILNLPELPTDKAHDALVDAQHQLELVKLCKQQLFGE
jgi:hypothetical protein